jgi:DNA-binding NtrC family response regulator
VPALGERPEDIPELARHFLLRFAAEEGKRIARISGEALALLVGYRWPGNVRQLENAVFRAVVLVEGDEVGAAEFPQIAAQIGAHAQIPMAPALPLAADAEPIVSLMVESGPVAPTQAAPVPAASPAALALLNGHGQVRPLDEVETEVIRFAIAHYRGQMSEVARRLQIGRSTLYRKLDALGLVADTSDADTGPVVSG